MTDVNTDARNFHAAGILAHRHVLALLKKDEDALRVVQRDMSTYPPGYIVGWLGSIAAELVLHFTDTQDDAELVLLGMLQATLDSEPAP